MDLPEFHRGAVQESDGAIKPYVTVGDGPMPMVIVPGAVDGFRTAVDMAIYIAWFYRRRCRDFRLLVLSRREPIPPGYRIDEHARDMIRTAEALDWGPAVWECLSAGGPIGQSVAAQRPDLVRGLILSSAMHHAAGRTRTMLERWLTIAAENGSANVLFSPIEYKYRPPESVLSADQRSELKARKTRVYPGRLKRMLQPLVDLDHRDLVPRIVCPTLIVTGGKDRIVSVKLQQDMARRMANARQRICPGFGHFNDLENPDYHGLVGEFAGSFTQNGAHSIGRRVAEA